MNQQTSEGESHVWPPEPQGRIALDVSCKSKKLSTNNLWLDLLLGSIAGSVANLLLYLVLLVVGNLFHAQQGPLQEGPKAYTFAWAMWSLSLLGTLLLTVSVRHLSIAPRAASCFGACCMAGLNALIISLFSG